MTAYLVIREGSKWTDVFRLVEGESITIGRAPTNAIVVKDERCSRNHAEVFQSQGQWTLRDLDSRNGTVVDGKRLQADYSLQAGDIIRIGNSQLAFVHDLSQAFPDSHTLLAHGPGGRQRSAEARRRRRPMTRACSKPTSRRRSRIAAVKAASSSRPKKKTSMSRCPKSAGRRPIFAGWRSNWPKRRTSCRWRTSRSMACSKARRSMPAPSCCEPADQDAEADRR